MNGVIGLVLGGSRARGTADEHSDTDIGVYHRGLDLSAIREIADEYPGSTVAASGEWGPWVDGAPERFAERVTDILAAGDVPAARHLLADADLR